MLHSFLPILGAILPNTSNFYDLSLFSFLLENWFSVFLPPVGLCFYINIIFREINVGLTFKIVCISGFSTCGCYLVIGTILLAAVS